MCSSAHSIVKHAEINMSRQHQMCTITLTKDKLVHIILSVTISGKTVPELCIEHLVSQIGM